MSIQHQLKLNIGRPGNLYKLRQEYVSSKYSKVIPLGEPFSFSIGGSKKDNIQIKELKESHITLFFLDNVLVFQSNDKVKLFIDEENQSIKTGEKHTVSLNQETLSFKLIFPNKAIVKGKVVKKKITFPKKQWSIFKSNMVNFEKSESTK